MVRSTFKVLFYVNGSKGKNGIVPIMGRVTINGTVAQFSCKRSIPKDLSPKLKELSTPTACIRYAAVGVVPTWENAGEKELPHL